MNETQEALPSEQASLPDWSVFLLLLGGIVVFNVFDSGERGWILVAAIAVGVSIQAVGLYLAGGAGMRGKALRYAPLYLLGGLVLDSIRNALERPWWQEIPLALVGFSLLVWLWSSSSRRLERAVRRRTRA